MSGKKRRSCPVKTRVIMDLESFNKDDKSTFDGTETVRKLNKLDRKWFHENFVALVYSSKSFYGRTFVIPYKDICGIRYWLVDKQKKAKHEFYENLKEANNSYDL